jgi:uncharacterized protein (DUF2062 family)
MGTRRFESSRRHSKAATLVLGVTVPFLPVVNVHVVTPVILRWRTIIAHPIELEDANVPQAEA